MGIGLPICRSIVEGHGGTLETVAGGHPGAVFRIQLPPILLERDGTTPQRAQGAVHA
jgi:signal transduction histidine kinase